MKIARFGWLAFGVASATLFPSLAWSADAPKNGPATTDSAGGERLNVETLKRNYWNRSDDGSPRVVQNRLYSKAKKIELGVNGSLVSTDPFISVKSLGVMAGYHFTEEWGVNAMYLKMFSSPSAAEATIEAPPVQTTASTNYLNSYYGGEITFSPIYGKLALLNEIIIHYDFHLLAGGGVMDTETGNNLAFSWGLGQQVYIGKNVSLRIDYRNMRFSENLLSKDIASPTFGQVIKSRSNSTDVITLGVDFLFGFSSDKNQP